MTTESTDATTTTTTASTDATTTSTAATATDAEAVAAAASTTAAGTPGTTATVVEGAPETYADFAKPDGAEIAPTVATEVSTLAKELNLPQDKAQKVFDTAAKITAQHIATQVETVKAMNDGWKAETAADPEIGGDKLAENLAAANAAMKASASEKLIVLLDKSGLGNHPEMIRHFLKIAPAFAADKTIVPGGKAPEGTKDTAKVLYPNQS